MINPQLLDYIRQQLAAGVSKENIQKALLSGGWNQQDIDDTFAAVNAPIPPAPPVQPPAVVQSPQVVPPATPPSQNQTPLQKSDHSLGHIVRIVVYSILGFLIGAVITIIPQVSGGLENIVGPYGFIFGGLLFALIGGLFAYWLNSKLAHDILLPPARILLNNAFDEYVDYIGKLTGIGAVPVVFAFFSVIALTSLLSNLGAFFILSGVLAAVVGLVIYVFTAILSTLAFLWYLTHAGENVGVWASYKGALKTLFPFIWMTILSVLSAMGVLACVLLLQFVVIGAFFALVAVVFHASSSIVLVAIPIVVTVGVLSAFLCFIVVSILVGQSAYAFFIDNKRGVSALVQSWLYVRHKINAVFSRLLVLGIILGLLSLFVNVVASYGVTFLPAILGKSLISLSTIALTFLLTTPYSLVYGLSIYSHLKESFTANPTAGASEESIRKKLLAFISVGAVGAVLTILLLIVFIGPIIKFVTKNPLSTTGNSTTSNTSSTNDLINDLTRYTQLAILQETLNQYASGTQNKYPATLNDLNNFAATKAVLTNGVPSDPVTKQPYIYNVGPDNSYYSLCAILSTAQYQCVDSGSSDTYTIPGSSISPAVNELQTFTDPNGAFSYQYPATWVSTSTSPPGNTAVVAVAATTTDLTSGVRISQFTGIKVGLPAGTTLDQGEQALITAFKTVSGYSNLSSQKTTFHGDPAYLATFYTANAAGKLFNTSYLVSHKGSIYELYFLQKQEEAPLFTGVMVTVLDSFQILDSASQTQAPASGITRITDKHGNSTGFSKDSTHIYCTDINLIPPVANVAPSVLTGADPASFVALVDSNGNEIAIGKDTNAVYVMDSNACEAVANQNSWDPTYTPDPKTFAYVGGTPAGFYAKDKNYVYYWGGYFIDPVYGADPATFTYNASGGSFDGQDKNFKYLNGRKVQ